MPATSPTLIAILDGLRPAVLEPSKTPFPSPVASEARYYDRAVAALPALTRANMATLATGRRPGRTGIIRNQVWHHEPGIIDRAIPARKLP